MTLQQTHAPSLSRDIFMRFSDQHFDVCAVSIEMEVHVAVGLEN